MLIMKVSFRIEYIKLYRFTQFCCSNMVKFCQDLALAIALVSRWVCEAMACAKCEGQFERESF